MSVSNGGTSFKNKNRPPSGCLIGRAFTCKDCDRFMDWVHYPTMVCGDCLEARAVKERAP